MAIQLSVADRNARLNVFNSWGTGATLHGYTGSPPANCAASATGTNLFVEALSSTPFLTASGGQITLASLPISVAGGNNGTVGYFRIYDSSSVCRVQGTCGLSSADMIFDNITIVTGQTVTITGFTFTDGNA